MDNYPDIDDPELQFKLAQRLEFRNLHNVDGLYPHQEFVRRFMSPYTPYRSLIMYHSLGSGKSIACIAVAVDHYLHDGKKCIIVTKGDSGTGNFMSQIRMYKNMSASGIRNEWDTPIFVMKHYISMSNQVNNMSDDEVRQKFSNCIIVLDEVHNVRYLKRVTENSVYGSIVRLLKLCTGVKIIIATATPMTDNHEQIHSLLGICNYFRDDPWSMNGIVSYNCVIQDRPASTEIGTCEYVPGVRVYASMMTAHQRYAYSRENSDKPPDDIYRKLTHISLFCFEDGTYGRRITDKIMTKTRKITTISSMSTKKIREIRYVKYDVVPDFCEHLVGERLRNSSSKYSAVVDLLSNSTGNVFIFLEEVKGSGLLLLASILEQHGYRLYLGEDIGSIPPGKRYTMCVGSAEICPNNIDRLEGFNCDENKNGEYVRVLLGSRVIGESITLRNVRQFYCLTPHWNDSTVDQAIGRVVRNGSHASLRKEERQVNIYIHASIYPDDPHNSVDIKKLARCKEKERSILEVTQRMVECAVDRYCLMDDQLAIAPERVPSPTAEGAMAVTAQEPAGAGRLPITYVDTFAAAYVHHHEAAVGDAIGRVLSALRQEDLPLPLHSNNKWTKGGPVDVYDLSNAIGVHPTVCKEIICRMIYSNVHVTANGGGFIRAYGNSAFVVDDPSLPYVVMPYSRTPNIIRNLDSKYSSKGYTDFGPSSADGAVGAVRLAKYEDSHEKGCLYEGSSTGEVTKERAGSLIQEMEVPKQGISASFPHFLELFRYMRVKNKSELLEQCITHNLSDALEQVSTAYADIGGTIYHLLLYRDLDSSYTSSNPVPKVPLGRTRAFDRASRMWTTVVSAREEKRIFGAYRKLVDDTIEHADRHLDIYGVISTIDGEMRLRLRSMENVDKSSVDRRYVKRGKNMKSIRKNQLLDILSYVRGSSSIGLYRSNCPSIGVRSPLSSWTKGWDNNRKTVDQTDGPTGNIPINEIVKLIDDALVDALRYIVL